MEDFKSFAALIFVTENEKQVILRMFDWEPVAFPNDDQLYYRTKDSHGKLIYAARTDEKGMTAASVLSMKLIEHFRPKYILMPGILAGIYETEQLYGDVVLADMVWNYSNGKYVTKDRAEITFGDIGFEPRPTCITVDKDLISYFNKALYSAENEAHVHVGAIATGASVVANKSVVEKQVMGQEYKTMGLEMEGYGVAYAASHATEPKPKAIIAKSICDFADSNKSDDYKKFAAYTSCEFVKFMIEKVLD